MLSQYAVCTAYRTRHDPRKRRECPALCLGMLAIGRSTVILLAGVTDCSTIAHKLKNQAFGVACSEKINSADVFRMIVTSLVLPRNLAHAHLSHS